MRGLVAGTWQVIPVATHYSVLEEPDSAVELSLCSFLSQSINSHVLCVPFKTVFIVPLAHNKQEREHSKFLSFSVLYLINN